MIEPSLVEGIEDHKRALMDALAQVVEHFGGTSGFIYISGYVAHDEAARGAVGTLVMTGPLASLPELVDAMRVGADNFERAHDELSERNARRN